MYIAFFSPSDAACHAFTPDWLYGQGMGGAEQSVVLLARALSVKHNVEVYNNVQREQWFGDVPYIPKSEFNPVEKFDVVVLNRAPAPALTAELRDKNPRVKIIAFSCDQQTEGDYAQWFKDVDHVFAISDYHNTYLQMRYGVDPNKITTLDLPIAVQDYLPYNSAPRENLFLWSSQAERGLDLMATAWPVIKRLVPDARLVVTADHSLWGADIRQKPYVNAARYKQLLFDGYEDVNILNAIPRRDLVRLQKAAKLQLSSLTYPELFCISAMEAQAAGAIPVVSALGALPTTVMVGECVYGNPEDDEWLDTWIEQVVAFARHPKLPALSCEAHERAVSRCSPAVIARQWECLLAGL